MPQVMTKAENDDEDFLFLFYPETDSAVAHGRASLARIKAQPVQGPKTTTTAFLGQAKAISTWPGCFTG